MPHSGFPTRFSVEILRTGGVVEDRFGNEVPTPGVWESVAVFGWAVNDTSEETGTSVLRTKDLLTLYVPRGSAPAPSEQVRLPDGSVWEVQGHGEDYDHNPWFQPGILVVTCKKVEG